MPVFEKLKSVALLSSLVASIYFLSGITINLDRPIPILGIPISIREPKYIDIGLLVISVYASFRYLYYGLMRLESPARKRDNLLRGFTLRQIPVGKKWSLSKEYNHYIKKISSSEKEDSKQLLAQITMAYPKVLWFKSIGEIKEQKVSNTNKIYHIEVTIPRTCRLVARLEDLDYWLPIILGALSITLYFYR
nr:hypothetical protein BCU10_14465 [Vibrio splendidus]